MGAVDIGGTGCICPESAMLKTLFTHLLFRKDDILILDMYAGVEHLGRATVDFVDAMLIVVEPTRRSLGTAVQIKKLANDIGLDRLWIVGNKIRNEEEADFLRSETPELKITIGNENEEKLIQECSIITAPYTVGEIDGLLGVIGPMRMAYRRVIPIVDYTAKLITQIFQER